MDNSKKTNKNGSTSNKQSDDFVKQEIQKLISNPLIKKTLPKKQLDDLKEIIKKRK
jgi:hypothetical protein